MLFAVSLALVSLLNSFLAARVPSGGHPSIRKILLCCLNVMPKLFRY